MSAHHVLVGIFTYSQPLAQSIGNLILSFWSQSSYLNIVNFIVMQTDKASMLDEIIDYLKFLQLQVKVKISSC